MKTELVKNWMTNDPISIHPQNTITQARKIMTENRIRRLPVIDGDELVGIITLGDIREAEPSDAALFRPYEKDHLLEFVTIDSIMTPNPITISPDATIAEAAQLMLVHRIGGLPVIKEDTLVGIITETDFCRLLIQTE